MAKPVLGPLSPNRLVVCALINQLATPGLGSWFARRRIAGAGQLALAFAGFGLVVVWMFDSFFTMFSQAFDQPTSFAAPEWMWKWGWTVFCVSWVWALITSVGLWRQAHLLQKAGNVPPRISDPPAASDA